jgi:nicotinamidase/pyrazinamidase
MKRILVVVDYQNDFVNGSVPCGQAAVDIDKRLSDKICNYMLKQDEIIFTKACHEPGIYEKSRESRKIPIHCIPNTPGFELFGTLSMMTNIARSRVVVKGCPDHDGIVDSITIMTANEEIELIELVGIPTHLGVLQYAVILQHSFPNIPIWVDPKCCASWDIEKHKQALSIMEDMGIGIGYA